MRAAFFRKQLAVIFYQLVAVAGIFYALLIVSGIMLYPKIALLLRSVGGSTKIVCNCENLISFSTDPIIFAGYPVMGVILAFFVISGAVKITMLQRHTSRYIKRIIAHTVPVSEKLLACAKHLDIQDKITEVSVPEPVVFCFGYRRPSLCVSSRLVNRFSQDELKAVLLHEKQHIARHEPLRLFIITSAAKIFGRIPGVRALEKRYKVLSELYADFHATSGFTDKGPLARALYKVINLKKHMLQKNQLPISSFTAVTDQRIEFLTSFPVLKKTKNGTMSFIASLAVIGVFFFGFHHIFLSAPKAKAQFAYGQCKEIFNPEESQCKASHNQACAMTYFLESPLCR